ncbi:hypothetical protein FVEN_g5601 [Fusarium venenatum]|uniref:Uncharacterized protein n=1 Tax=Fusarium venenatum TaxID=56646 RepID=A0A2L2TBQ4_9HYPO|nr:uncharacterized protein FVRRES_04010 [Fusarium venenatum]KAG8356468.1 hypothetical protein FVEN_g5601 [Fusarium venenatum]KAH7003025.1 hypothetical protein EDB82DRAFT_519077 [Fusarium venenatum]CEI67498.1 unnamed protein product [Fusarium venenatum]
MSNGGPTHDIPNDQGSQKERLFDPTATPLRFATHKVNMATPNNNQDRRGVEQWQLDSTNAQHEEMVSHIHHQQEEIDDLKDRIARIDAVQEDTVEKPATTEQEIVRDRSSSYKILSFLWLIYKLLLLLAIILGILYLVKYHIYDDWNYVGYFLDLLDIDYPHFF